MLDVWKCLYRNKKNTITNSIIDLRNGIKPITDLDYLSWLLWYDQTINLPIIKKLQRKNVCLVSDLLGLTWEIMTKEELERTKGINLNFLEYMAIKQSVKRFIVNAEKKRVNIGPYRPLLLNIVFSQKRVSKYI